MLNIEYQLPCLLFSVKRDVEATIAKSRSQVLHVCLVCLCFSDNYIVLEVFFGQLRTETITQSLSYDALSFIGKC
jgi:hypothetical protein